YYSREYFQRHPDTGFAFKNFNDNIWNGIRNFSIEAAEKFPQFQYLGWDIGLSKTGPIAIETNRNFCITAPQIVLGGLREQFRIENPDYYWKNLNKSPCHSIY
ncbi:sugar-transfer associated ATP-grasp domain-containing protein, partial [Methanocalculus sp.]|uniref:sugar-transfer associated ATP-grasp domain-containing protein n=1 Tax=Methanocalculus sp. TaxID=2004547 RepID=UPI002610CEED